MSFFFYIFAISQPGKDNLAACCPVCSAGALLLTGQLVLRTVTFVTEVGVSVD